MKTNELWARLRKLLRRRTPSREIEGIVSGFRADETLGHNRFTRRRERLDVNLGWVSDDSGQAGNQANGGRPHGPPGRSGAKQR